MNALDISYLLLVPMLGAAVGAVFYILFGFLDRDPELINPGVVRRAHVLSEPPMKNQASGIIDVLVVDDSAVARAKLEKLLVSSGYSVRLANDGEEALVLLAEQQFCLLITDLEMPNMNGFELIACVQGGIRTEDLPIIAITGHEEMQARVHDCQGWYGIFKKPWNDRELLKRVATLVLLRRQGIVLA